MMDNERPEITIFSGVYPPSEDTYLLLDSLDIRKEDTFLEVGCGTGVISVSVAGQIERVVCLDSSFDAVRNTKENLRRNHISHRCHVIEADLLSALSPSVKFSLIVFNPPYLPQDETHTDLDQALVGGETGTETTQRFIRQVVEHLLKNGRVYVVVSSLANIDSIQQTMIDSGLSVGIASEASLFFEKIQVLRGVL